MRFSRVMVLFFVAASRLVAATAGPVTVAPGADKGVGLVSSRCPTFHWTGVGESDSVDLVVYRVPETGETIQGDSGAPVLKVALPGGASGWTPSVGQCFEQGGRYAWSVRTSVADVSSDWTAPRLFEVKRAPSVEEVEDALETLRLYVDREGASGRTLPTQAPQTAAQAGMGPLVGSSPSPQGGALVFDTTGMNIELTEVGVYSMAGIHALVPGSYDTSRSAVVGEITGLDGYGVGVRGIGGQVGVLASGWGRGVEATGNVGVEAFGGFRGVYGRSDGGTAGVFQGESSARALMARSGLCCNGFTPGSHTAHIYSTGGSGGDVLALRNSSSNLTTDTNFIGFFEQYSVLLGEIQADGMGGVELVGGLAGPASDFAEYLPKLDEADELEPAEVVGLYAGRVSRRTEGADRAMVVSTRPIVSAGRPEPGEEARFAQVAFVGQVPVRVRGKVEAGDLLVPSGLEDGLAIAVAARDLAPEQSQLIVGRALEAASGGSEISQVKTLVGLTEVSEAGAWLAAEREIRLYRWTLAAMLALVLALSIRTRRTIIGA